MNGRIHTQLSRNFTLALLAMGLLATVGCTSAKNEPDIAGANYARVQVPNVSDPLGAAHSAFAEERFAHAARYYEMAMARQGESHEALLGAAAAYDRMWRFDLADTVYQRAEPRIGGTAEYLNNRGYSYLMQGRFEEAEHYFARAQQMVPDDPVIAGNLRLLQRLAGPSRNSHAG